MTKFASRSPEWIDILPRFEEGAAPDHFRNAISHIQRLENNGARLLGRESDQFERWRQACKELESHITSLGASQDRELATSLREFIHSFEHHTERMYQIVQGISANSEGDTSVRQMLALFDLVYKLSTYAIISTFIPDKKPTSTLWTSINLTTGQHTRGGEYTEPPVPRRYRAAAKKVWRTRRVS